MAHAGFAGFARRFRPALLLLLSLSAAALLLIFYISDPAAWGSLARMHSFLPHQDPASQVQAQPTLDVQALRENFARLKNATRPISGHFSNQLDQLMTQHVPVVNTTYWRLHSPGGKEFTVDQVTAVSVASMHPGGFLVPNVAHIILPFGDRTLYFHHMVSILSCIHVMKPHRLLMWYAPGRLPEGKWWDRVKKNLTDREWEEKVIMVQREIPTSIYNHPVHGKEHQSDVMRMEAVLVFGGFYMDMDVFVLKPLDQLRRFPCTIGRETGDGLCNGAFMSAPNGTFLAMWHTAYQVFSDNAWNEHSVLLPHKMHRFFPDLCHVQEKGMDRPNWTGDELNWIYGIGQQGRWDWRSKNFVMHLWFRLYGKHHDLDNIRKLNSTYGQMCRFILFGSV